MEAGRAVLVEADHELDRGIWLEPAFGHTPGNVNVNVRNGDRHALLCGDTMHTPLQLCDPGLSSAFCEDPAMSARSRTAMVERLADTDSILLAGHFPYARRRPGRATPGGFPPRHRGLSSGGLHRAWAVVILANS